MAPILRRPPAALRHPRSTRLARAAGSLRHPRAALGRHLRSRTRGQSLIEFALILPVFLMFFAAILDLGRVAAAQIAIANAAREGAFQAAQTPTDFDSS